MSHPFKIKPRDRRRADLDAELLKARAEEQLQSIQASGDERIARIFDHAKAEATERNNQDLLAAICQMKRVPVTIDEFIESEEYLGNLITVWPALRDDLRRINPDIIVGEPPVHVAVLGGGIGTGKTTTAIITTAYQIYLLTCFEEPQKLFGLPSSTTLVFAIQSVTPDVTHTAIYQPLRALVEDMPHARRYWSWNRRKKKALEFECGIKVGPVVASVRATAGQAVIGIIQDEANLMEVVERSKRVPGATGMGGRFDQAQDLYRHHSRRRDSRFITRGYSIGTLCVIGSANYQGDFIDRRMAEARDHEQANVVTIRHSLYEVAPRERYSGETFRLQVGNQDYPTRILGDEEVAVEGLQVEEVPVEFKSAFQLDPENALRDIVGVASGVTRPFIAQRDKIVEATSAGRELELSQWVERSNFELAVHGYPEWIEAAMPDDRDKPRFIHVDLSLKHDRCGIAIVKMVGMENRADPQNPEYIETLPRLIVECAFTLQPSPMAHLDFAKVRSFLVQLKTHYGINVRQISYDGFESQESIQFLMKAGIRSQKISVDRTTEPYEYFRSALYQGRVAMVENELLMQELSQLEINAETCKVDHPPRGTKDLADAVAGAVFAAAQDRRTRAQTGPLDSSGEPPRQKRRRNVNRRDVKRRNKERRPGHPRRKTNGQILKEEREARYLRDWEALWIGPKKPYG